MAHSRARVGAGLCAVALVAACGSTAQVSRSLTSQQGGLQSGAGPTAEGLVPGDGGPSAGSGSPGELAGGAPGSGQASTGRFGRSPSTLGSVRAGGASDGGRTTSLPRTGTGWDASSVYIGIPTEEDVHRYAGSIGINFDPGSLEADAKALIADLNAKGGLFGRHVVPVFHDNATTDLEANPSAAAQANCTAFTEDHQVIAVVNAIPLIDTANWHACLQRHHTPLLTATSVLYDSTSFKQYGPYVWHTLEPNMSVFAPALMSHLRRLQYFTGWDTTAGAPGPGSARVGILMPNDAVSQRVARTMRARLRQLGVTVASEYAYQDSAGSYGPDMSSAVLQFGAAHVTHVVNIPPIALALITFMQTAEKQRYRPRYAMNSVINPFAITPNVPKAQLNGSLGIGWLPDTDVDTAHDPGATGPQRDCLAALKRSGLSFPGDGRRTALFAAFTLCTSLKLVVQAAAHAGGLAPQQLAGGIASVGTGFPTAPTFHSGLSGSDPAMPDVVRDLIYTAGCTCFTYRGGQHRL